MKGDTQHAPSLSSQLSAFPRGCSNGNNGNTLETADDRRRQTMQANLIAVDIGNVNIKLRSRGGNWDIVPAVVRRAPDKATYRLIDDEQPRVLRYLSGPAMVLTGEEGGRQSG